VRRHMGVSSIDVVAVHARLGSLVIRGHAPTLVGGEASIVSGYLPHRIVEFSAGRNAARIAMQALGAPASEILQGEGGQPTWPAGLCGSISHTNAVAVSLVAPLTAFESVGVDVDDGRPLDPEASRFVASKRELGLLMAIGLARSPIEASCLVFSIKEAVFKCQFALTGVRGLRFHQVRLVCAPGGSAASVAVSGWRTSVAVGDVLRRIVVQVHSVRCGRVACALIAARPRDV
jgi:4'-phosphopantetheinyl transferase EntD